MKTLLIPLIGSGLCMLLAAILAWTQPGTMLRAAEPFPWAGEEPLPPPVDLCAGRSDL